MPSRSFYSRSTITPPPPQPSLWERWNNYCVPILQKVMRHKKVDQVVIFLIFLSIFLLLLENTLPPHQVGWVEVLNDVITVVFVIELVLRFFSFRSKVRFFNDYWFDIIAVLAPFLRPLRILRVVRLLRFLRAGKWLRLHPYVSSLFILSFSFVISGAIGFRYAEPSNVQIKTFSDSLWFSLFTMVGGEPIVGDPARSFVGRFITFLLILLGLVLFAIVIGVISDLVIKKRGIVWERFKSMYIGEFDNHIVICGWNRCSNTLIRKLQLSPEYRHIPIVVVAEFCEPEPEVLLDKEISRDFLELLTGDYTRIEVLRKVRIEKARRAILLSDKCIARSDQDRDARTILAALLIERENPGIHTCVELLNRDNAAQLANIHVEEFFVADDHAGSILANAQRISGMLPMFTTLFHPEKESQFYQIEVPEKWQGLKVSDIYQELKEKHNAILISILATLTDFKTGEPVGKVPILNPPMDHLLKPQEELILIASRKPEL